MSPTPDERRSVVDVHCAECGGHIGRVVVIEDRWVWVSHDRRLARLTRRGSDFASRGVHAGQVIYAPDFPDLEAPDRLPARCRQHGTGHIPTSEVVAATAAARVAQRRRIALRLLQ